MEEHHIPVSLPLDGDRFLRRECPACERESKWLHSEDAEPAPDGGYLCPYCQQPAEPSSWFTPAQAEYVTRKAGGEVLGPIFDHYASRGFEFTREPEPEPLTEVNDMRRVEFACHPSQPIKVREEWSGPVTCIICGSEA